MALTEQFRIAATDKQKTVAVARLIKASTGDFDFYLFAFFGIIMAALGLILDSAEVVIGGMLIAPVLYPLLSLALSLVLADSNLLYRSARTVFISFGLSIFVAYLVSLLTILVTNGDLMSGQVLARAHPSVLYFAIAFISGFAATYALMHANLNELLPGVAISVSLVPPLAVVGIGVASGEAALATAAFELFAINVVGIVFASTIAFSLIRPQSTHKVAESAIKQEDKRLEKEAEKIEKIEEEKGNGVQHTSSNQLP